MSMGVVMQERTQQERFELTPGEDQHPARHSRLMLPTKRSAKALARGLGTRLRMFGSPGTERPRRTPTCGHALPRRRTHPGRGLLTAYEGFGIMISAAVATLGGLIAAERSPGRVRHGKLATPKREDDQDRGTSGANGKPSVHRAPPSKAKTRASYPSSGSTKPDPALPRPQGGGKGVGETKIGPTDGCRGETSTGPPGTRIDQMGAALGGARRCDGAEELDYAGEMARNGSTMPIRNGSGRPAPPKLAMSPAAFTMAPTISLDGSSASADCAAHPFT